MGNELSIYDRVSNNLIGKQQKRPRAKTEEYRNMPFANQAEKFAQIQNLTLLRKMPWDMLE